MYSDYFTSSPKWVEIDIPDIPVGGDFYIGVFTNWQNWQPQGHLLWLGADTDPPHSYRSFFVRDDTNGIFSVEDSKDWMIRAVGQVPGDGVHTYYGLLLANGYLPDDPWLINDANEKTSHNDVYYMFNTLEGCSNWDASRISWATNWATDGGVTEDVFENRLHMIGQQMDADDVFLFYYSGHGSPDGLLLSNEDIIKPSEMEHAFNNCIPPGAKKVAIIHACNSGIFPDHFRSKETDDIFALSTTTASQTASVFSWVMLMPWNRSYANYFITGGLEGAADLPICGGNYDHDVSTTELFDYIYWRIRIFSLLPMTPQKYVAADTADLAVTKDCPAVPETAMEIGALCPVDLSIEDPDGILIDKQSSEAVGVLYAEEDVNDDGDPDDLILIPYPKTGDYQIMVIPESGASPTDTYSLEVSADGVTIMLADNVQIGAIPCEGYIVRLTQTEIIQIIPATMGFDPNTLNLRSRGKYVTAYIELPTGYDVAQIDVSSISLNGTVPALTKPTEIGDYDKDGIPDLMVKFDRSAVIALLTPGDQAAVTIAGEVGGIAFEGTDTIRVINPQPQPHFLWYII